MFRTIMTSKMGMNANQERLDVISNNLANSSTVGYKKVNLGFKSLLQESLDRKGYPVNDRNSDMGTGVRTTEWFRDSKQGDLMTTDISTDFAIDGEGYFGINMPDGSTAYTRDGAFKIDVNGTLVDSQGNKVEIEFAEGNSYNNIRFSEDNFLVKDDGNIYMELDGAIERVCSIPIYTAIGDNAFRSIGDNLYSLSEDANLQRSTNFNINQGLLEMSNIDMSTEFTDMIVTQRAFQLSSKSLQTADEMWGMINAMRK